MDDTFISGKVLGFNSKQLRNDVIAGKHSLRITSHAQVEAFKDGLFLSDLRYTFEQGEVIEIYPDDHRGLLYTKLPKRDLPIHIVVEDTLDAGVVVTAYLPDKRKWIADKQRRKAKGK